jgi:hypothetical protein
MVVLGTTIIASDSCSASDFKSDKTLGVTGVPSAASTDIAASAGE